MSDYRRNYVPGGTYFFTCVTYHRTPILTTELGRRCLRDAIQQVRGLHPFTTVASVLLPDHWHTVWTLPRGDERYPMRWARIKEEFTKHWLDLGGSEQAQSLSRRKHRMRGIWQRRFWEHTIRDEDDLERCVDYIHWNPCKHGHADRVRDWPWSSFHRYIARGQYDPAWGRIDPVPGWDNPEYFD